MLDQSKIVRILRRALKFHATYHAQWMLTRRCNYRCRGCDIWSDQEGIELSTEKIKLGLDILRDLGVLEIVFSGGNPLIRNDIEEILDYASKNFITTVYDNGSMAAKKIESLRNVDLVAISIDTLDERKNDYLRGVPGAWRTAIHAIEALKKEGIPVGVSPTISQQNLHNIIDFTRYFISLDVPVWYCLYWYDYPLGNAMFSIGKRNEELEILNRDMLVDVCETVLEMKKQHNNIYITDRALEAVRQLALTGQRTWVCKALTNFLVIDNRGRVAGCHGREPLASIFELPELWNSPRFKHLRREYEKCTNCAYLCYIVYSIHGGILGNIEILKDLWESAKLYVKEVTAKSPSQTSR